MRLMLINNKKVVINFFSILYLWQLYRNFNNDLPLLQQFLIWNRHDQKRWTEISVFSVLEKFPILVLILFNCILSWSDLIVSLCFWTHVNEMFTFFLASFQSLCFWFRTIWPQNRQTEERSGRSPKSARCCCCCCSCRCPPRLEVSPRT